MAPFAVRQIAFNFANATFLPPASYQLVEVNRLFLKTQKNWENLRIIYADTFSVTTPAVRFR
jgi:hypothetical protein